MKSSEEQIKYFYKDSIILLNFLFNMWMDSQEDNVKSKTINYFSSIFLEKGYLEKERYFIITETIKQSNISDSSKKSFIEGINIIYNHE